MDTLVISLGVTAIPSHPATAPHLGIFPVEKCSVQPDRRKARQENLNRSLSHFRKPILLVELGLLTRLSKCRCTPSARLFIFDFHCSSLFNCPNSMTAARAAGPSATEPDQRVRNRSASSISVPIFSQTLRKMPDGCPPARVCLIIHRRERCCSHTNETWNRVLPHAPLIQSCRQLPDWCHLVTIQFTMR